MVSFVFSSSPGRKAVFMSMSVILMVKLILA
jgi:hypothetical protein